LATALAAAQVPLVPEGHQPVRVFLGKRQTPLTLGVRRERQTTPHGSAAAGTQGRAITSTWLWYLPYEGLPQFWHAGTVTVSLRPRRPAVQGNPPHKTCDHKRMLRLRLCAGRRRARTPGQGRALWGGARGMQRGRWTVPAPRVAPGLWCCLARGIFGQAHAARRAGRGRASLLPPLTLCLPA